VFGKTLFAIWAILFGNVNKVSIVSLTAMRFPHCDDADSVSCNISLVLPFISVSLCRLILLLGGFAIFFLLFFSVKGLVRVRQRPEQSAFEPVPPNETAQN
jgi:hypothetical protein